MSVALAIGSVGAVLADDDTDKGSPIGLFVVLILVVAVYFLWRSLSRHLRRIPESFDPPAGDGVESDSVVSAPVASAAEDSNHDAAADAGSGSVDLRKDAPTD
jgi:hypothetical protein